MHDALFRLKATPSVQLIGLYVQEYKELRGEDKFRGVFSKVHDGSKIPAYVQLLINSKRWPNLKEVGGIINSMSYFIFSKPETVLMGIITTYCYWLKLASESGINVPELEFREMILEALLYGQPEPLQINNDKGFFETFFRVAYLIFPMNQQGDFAPYEPIYNPALTINFPG